MDGMDILYLLIPLSLVLVFVIAALFWWSLKSGQYEDLEGPGHRILMDDDRTDSLKNRSTVDPDQGTTEARSNHTADGFYGDGFAPLPEGSLLGLGVRAAHPFFSSGDPVGLLVGTEEIRTHRAINHTDVIVNFIEVGYILTCIKPTLMFSV
jgi:cbb3-type cytochrome oxidase maturation protein